MKRSQSLLVFFVTFLIFPAVAHAQAWSGIISPERATVWAGAGVVGGIPSASWTQCGSTIAAYSGTAATINNAITACGKNQCVILGAGTFNLSSGITMGGKSNVCVRGQGANSTFLVFRGGVNCLESGSQFGLCIQSTDSTFGTQPPANIYNWTAGYAQGTNQITLSSAALINIVGGASPPTLLVLDQCDDGYTGSTCAGSSVDTGNIFTCADLFSPSGPTGCTANGPDSGQGNRQPARFHWEIVEATACNPSPCAAGRTVVTIKPPLQHPNWRSGQSPAAWLIQPITNSGFENLSVDMSALTGAGGIGIANASHVWAKGIRVVNAWAEGVFARTSAHFQLESNYIYNSGQNLANPDPFGIRYNGSNYLIQNNICQKNKECIFPEGPSNGGVLAYNFVANSFNDAEGMAQGIRTHAVNNLELYEGNISNNFDDDDFHGTHFGQTHFRNFYAGWESCANGQCGSFTAKQGYTSAFIAEAYSRYSNAIANVLGTPGYHTTYSACNTTNGLDKVIWNVGQGNGAGSGGSIPCDTISRDSVLKWGNYDTVTGLPLFCSAGHTNFGSCPNGSEVPTGALLFPNLLPTLGDTSAGQAALPASFYLSSKPSWFGSLPWPPIGPDVSSGNVGQCAGSLNVSGKFNGVAATDASQCAGSGLSTAWAGHVNANPAMNCALNVMGMPPDGSGNVLAFDASACYGGSSSSKAPNPPTSLVVVVN